MTLCSTACHFDPSDGGWPFSSTSSPDLLIRPWGALRAEDGFLRVTVSSHGKFHSFSLARQLAARGALERLLTTDPRAWREPGIPLSKAWALPVAELIGRMPRFAPPLAGVLPWELIRSRIYSRWAAAALGQPDLLVAWSGAAKRALNVAKARGIVTILERGSTHIAHQDRVLREESARQGVADGVPPENVAQELAEYEIADRIMVPSKFARRTFLERGFPESKLLQVPYGADVSLFSPGVREDDVFRVIFVGGVGLRKGTVYLLEAFKRLRLPNSELVLAGGIANPSILTPYQGVYRMAGVLGRAEVARWMQQSSVFVHPSLEEGLSLALREALASGLPVIATPETGAEDALVHGRDGFLVPSRDVDALCERLEQLYRDRALREEMSRQAARHAREWTWDNYGEAVYATYQQVLRDYQ